MGPGVINPTGRGDGRGCDYGGGRRSQGTQDSDVCKRGVNKERRTKPAPRTLAHLRGAPPHPSVSQLLFATCYPSLLAEPLLALRNCGKVPRHSRKGPRACSMLPPQHGACGDVTELLIYTVSLESSGSTSSPGAHSSRAQWALRKRLLQ